MRIARFTEKLAARKRSYNRNLTRELQQCYASHCYAYEKTTRDHSIKRHRDLT